MTASIVIAGQGPTSARRPIHPAASAVAATARITSVTSTRHRNAFAVTGGRADRTTSAATMSDTGTAIARPTNAPMIVPRTGAPPFRSLFL